MDNEGTQQGPYNKFLQPENSPVTSHTRPKGSYYFNRIAGADSVGPSKIPYLPVGKLAAGTVVVGINVGSTGTAGAYIKIDGAANRILINDGTTNRIVIGSV